MPGILTARRRDDQTVGAGCRIRANCTLRRLCDLECPRLPRGFIVDGLNLAVQVRDQELGEVAEVQIERGASEHGLEIAGLVAQAIEDRAPEIGAEIGSAKRHAAGESDERFQFAPRVRGREPARQSRPVEQAAQRADPLEIGAGIVDLLKDGTEIGQHLTTWPERDEVQSGGALIGLARYKWKETAFLLEPARELRARQRGE